MRFYKNIYIHIKIIKYKVYIKLSPTHNSHVSTVPKRHFLALQAVLIAGTLSISHFSLKALKYGDTGRPDIALK